MMASFANRDELVLASGKVASGGGAHIFRQHVDVLEKILPHEGVVTLRQRLSHDDDTAAVNRGCH